MGERPDEVGRRDPLGRPDPLAGEPGFDPATDAFDPDAVNRDPALRDEAGEVEVDRVEVTKVEIERTRADMSETVDAIQERLSPQNLKEQAKDRVKEATVGKAEQAMSDAGDRAREAGSGVVGTIRANPLPAALTGIGLGWLFVSARRQGPSRPPYRDASYGYPPTNEYAPPVSEYPSDYPPRYEDEETSGPSAAGQALGRARDGVGETATQAQEKASQVASQTRDKAGDLAGTVQDRASRLGDQTRSAARRVGTGSRRMMRENPLAVGALAVGVGAAVGLAIPETSKENEVMGEARDNLVDKAQEKAQDVQQRVQQVAEEAQGAAQQEAENQGLTQQ